MRILITGSEGRLARAIIRKAKKSKPVALGRDDLDITDFAATRKAVKKIEPDIIINCAAYNDVDGAETQWRKAFLINGIGPKNLAVSAADCGAVLVHFGTDYVFGRGGKAGSTKRPFTIADMPSPVNRYGESKLLGESYIREFSEKHFVIRVSRLFGEGGGFPYQILKWASKESSIKAACDQISNPTYIEDLVPAVMKLIASGQYGIYHMTNSGHCSLYEWAGFILKSAGWKGKLKKAEKAEFDTPAVRPYFSALDNFPLEETLNIVLPGWEDATRRFLGK